MWNIDLVQIQQCYDKQVTQRGSHKKERIKEVKKVSMVDVHSKNVQFLSLKSLQEGD
jgi:hypothetical protein